MFNYKIEAGTRYNTTKIITHSVLGLFALMLLMGSFTIVAPTEENVVLRLGKIDRTIASGFHWKLPLFDNVIIMDVSTVKVDVQASAASADLQDVTTILAIQYHLDRDGVGIIYQQYKRNVKSRVVDTAIQDAVKASTALFNADELITKRPQVKDEIFRVLSARLAEANITLKNVDITDFKFSDSFNRAIEAKVTAEQKAFEAENKLKQVEFEAAQRVATAEAEAEAIRIQAQAINSQGGRDFVQLKAIEKWNGVLPTQFVPGSAVPFLNLIR